MAKFSHHEGKPKVFTTLTVRGRDGVSLEMATELGLAMGVHVLREGRKVRAARAVLITEAFILARNGTESERVEWQMR